MSPSGRIKLVSQLLDLPIIDHDGRWCGVVDDVEFSGSAGVSRIKALLVGPGAYEGRLPAWMFSLVGRIAGRRMARVPVGKIEDIGCFVKLKCRGEDLGLLRAEDGLRGWIPRVGAL